MLSKKTRMLLLSTLAVAGSSLAIADTRVVVKSEIVRYDDLRLISTVGAAVLYARIHAAAERACGGADDGQLASKVHHRNCVQSAVDQAVTDVNEPILTQYYEAKRHTSSTDTTSTATAVAKAR